jgi:hypothetical protein
MEILAAIAMFGVVLVIVGVRCPGRGAPREIALF